MFLKLRLDSMRNKNFDNIDYRSVDVVPFFQNRFGRDAQCVLMTLKLTKETPNLMASHL